MGNRIKSCLPFGMFPICTFYKQPIHYQPSAGHQNIKATISIEI